MRKTTQQKVLLHSQISHCQAKSDFHALMEQDIRHDIEAQFDRPSLPPVTLTPVSPNWENTIESFLCRD